MVQDLWPLPPPPWREIPAFLRRNGPLCRPLAAFDAELDRHEALARADGIRQAAVLVFDITRSRWLAERLEALADNTARNDHASPPPE